MCGRIHVASDPLARLIQDITGREFVIDTRYNVAPTEQVPVLLKTREGDWALRDMRWWLVPGWSDGPSAKYAMFNAKSESLEKARAFRELFRRRRCIVPAAGYYEWHREGAARLPFHIAPQDGGGFAFAALWDRWRGKDEVIDSCTIVTVAATPSMAFVHDRMPAQLSRAEALAWMDPAAGRDELGRLLVPSIKTPLAVTPVSTYVNDARNKDERCVEPIGNAKIIAN